MREETRNRRLRRNSTVGFERTSDYYYGRARENHRRGRTSDALKLALKALQTDENDNAKLIEAAILAAELDLCALSSILISRALKQDCPRLDCLKAFYTNLLARGMFLEAARVRETWAEQGGTPEALECAIPAPITPPAGSRLNRRERKALLVMDEGCRLIGEGDLAAGCERIKAAYTLSPEQPLICANYALCISDHQKEKALVLAGNALRRVSRNPAERAQIRCICAQVFERAGQEREAEALYSLLRFDDVPEQMRRMIIYTLAEAGLHGRIYALARAELKRNGFSRELLHALSVAACALGLKASRVEEGWKALLSIDREEISAREYLRLYRSGKLVCDGLHYTSRMPADVTLSLIEQLSQAFSGNVNALWSGSDSFKSLLTRLCFECEFPALQKCAVQIVLGIDAPDAGSLASSLLLRPEIGDDIKSVIRGMLDAKWIDRFEKANYPLFMSCQPTGDESLAHEALWIRCIYRGAREYLRSYGMLSCNRLLAGVLSSVMEDKRTREACLRDPNSAEAALVWQTLQLSGNELPVSLIARDYELRPRQLKWMKRRISEVLHAHLRRESAQREKKHV